MCLRSRPHYVNHAHALCSRRSPRRRLPALPALSCSRHPLRSPFPALLAAAALRAAGPAPGATVSAAAARAPGPAHAVALLGGVPWPRAPRAANWRPLQPAPRFPQCGAPACWDWPRVSKARPPLAPRGRRVRGPERELRRPF